jgi:mono/diheme cytochrome c family protein
MQDIPQSRGRFTIALSVTAQQGPALHAGRMLGMTLLLAACNNVSDVGQLTDPSPTAVVATVAQPYTIDANGVLQTRVRAGAEVVLTGTSSHKGANDSGAPIITYNYEQLDPSPTTSVDLIRRTVDTDSFIAPEVRSEAALTFQLTVADAKGATSSAKAVVTVEPIRDADHFLHFSANSDKFVVTAVTSSVVPANSGAAYSATLPFTVTVTKLVTYTDIDGNQKSMVPIGQAVEYKGAWSSSLGSGGSNCADARNPQLQIPIPSLNLDDLLADGSARLTDVLETSDIDLDPKNPKIPRAVVYAQIKIEPAAPLPAGVSAEICVSDSMHINDHTAAPAVTSASDRLLVPPPPPAVAPPRPGAQPTPQLTDTSASAHQYYATIDPSSSKSTLNAWLSANGFKPDSADWGADAHAVYTNNYDLGFGRDMYMKIGPCDSGAASLPLQARIGKCNVAAVVVNYAGVQAAAYKINPIVAVAMEYSAAPGTSPAAARFTKFYVFAPDTRSGAFQRVTSVDLDRRGQKSVPQSCVVCHGGTSASHGGNPPSAPGSADISAGFLSWDLDSFYYSDTDPGFSTKREDTDVRAKYTRDMQEPEFKKLNSGAYLTFDDPNRFALARELIEGWYGGAGLPSASFDGAFVPPGWKPDGTDQNPKDSATVYSDVFARHCRACHVLQEPARDDKGEYIDPRDATETVAGAPIPSCSAMSIVPSPRDKPLGANQAHQIPMGCYWEFAHSPFLSSVLSSGAMPLARRTLDRLWVQPDGSKSAGAILQDHFSAQSPQVKIYFPGISIANISPPVTVEAQADTIPVTVPDVGNAIQLDSSRSAFPDSILWTVSACTGAPPPPEANPGQCNRNIPVVGIIDDIAWLLLDDAVTYRLTLKLDDGTGPATAETYFQVAALAPKFVVPAPVINVPIGGQVVVLPSTIFTYGNGGTSGSLVLLQPGSGLAVTPVACTVAPGCSGTAIATGFTVQSIAGVASTSSINVTVTGAGSSAQEVVSESVVVNVM